MAQTLDQLRALAGEEAAMSARHRTAYAAEPNFGRRHSILRKQDAEFDDWCRRVDALGMDDAECRVFMEARATFADGAPVTDADRAEAVTLCQACLRAPARWLDGGWWDCDECRERAERDRPEYQP